MTILPDPRTYLGLATNLITTPDGAFQYGVYVGGSCDNTIDGSQAFVFKRNRATGAIQLQDVSAAAGGVLALPVPHTAFAGEHNWFAITRDTLGYLHVWGNYVRHDQVMRYMKSHNPDDITAWTAQAALPNNAGINGHDYPIPTIMPNGDIWFLGGLVSDTGSSGSSDRYDWRLPAGTATWKGGDGVSAYGRKFLQGVSVPNAKGPGVAGDSFTPDSEFNWFAYVTTPAVDWTRGRVWLGWVWRVHGLTEPSIKPSCAYSADNGKTWHAANGTAVTLPIDPVNDTSAQCGVTAPVGGGSGYAYSNSYMGQLAVDPATGYPVFALAVVQDGTPSGSSAYAKIAWNGTQWVQTAVPRPIAGLSWAHVPTPVYFGGDLWWKFAAYENNDTTTRVKRAYLCKDDDSTFIRITGDINPIGGYEMDDGTYTANFMPPPDPIAYKLYGNLEYLVPVTNTPRVITLLPSVRLANA